MQILTIPHERLLELISEKISDSRVLGLIDLFQGKSRWPRKKSLGKLKDTLRAKTKRANGHSLKTIIVDVNQTLVGWFEYFKHSNKYTFPPLDSWIRMRLRSILRKRAGLKARGRGRDHQRWPNNFFTDAGLFSLVNARQDVSQSSTR